MRFFTTTQRFALLFACCFGLMQAQIKVHYPVTAKEPVAEDYFGTKVTDDYRWLEDDRSEQTAAWVKEQNVATQNYFN